MGIRELLNKSPGIALGILAGLVVLLLVAFWSRFQAAPELKRSWYTVDDGKTYFADDIEKVPPFTKDGKTAYGCDVFTCDGGKTTFVGYLVRYRPGAEAEFNALHRPSASSGTELEDYYARRNAVDLRTREVKPPMTGDDGWVLARSGQAGMAVTSVKCRGADGVPESVLP